MKKIANVNQHRGLLVYRGNNTSHGHSYNERRIGTRTWSIEWCHFHWSWGIPEGHVIRQRQLKKVQDGSIHSYNGVL